MQSSEEKIIQQESIYEIGTIFSQAYIKEIKQTLEIKYGTKLSRMKSQEKMSIICRQHSSCPFKYNFNKQWSDLNSQQGYQLVSINHHHSIYCELDWELHHFYHNKQLINELRNKIYAIISERMPDYGIQNPKKLLIVLSRHLGVKQSFIFQGLVDRNLQRKMKKKFDNVVADTRRQVLQHKQILRKKKLTEVTNQQ